MQADGVPTDWSRDGEDDDPVLAWRTLRFLDLAFDEMSAALLAESRADVHDVEKLIAAGCPLAIALKILL